LNQALFAIRAPLGRPSAGHPHDDLSLSLAGSFPLRVFPGYTVTPTVGFGMSGPQSAVVEGLGWPMIDGVREMDCARRDGMALRWGAIWGMVTLRADGGCVILAAKGCFDRGRERHYLLRRNSE
jgi:hypothetical protein